MSQTLVNIGFGNLVVSARIVGIITPSSAPMKRLKEEARQQGKLIDATQGRKTRAVIITDSDHVILSAVQPATVAQRFADEGESKLAEGESKLAEGKSRLAEGKSRLAESAREEQAS